MKEGALHELPGGWVWTRLECCIEILDSKRVPINAEERKKRIAGKATSELYPYYGATGQVGWIDDFLLDEELILLGEDGAPFFESTKNKAYLIKGKSWVNNHAHVLKAISSITLNQFLCHYLNIFNYQGYVTGTTRYKLNQSPMRNIPIPLPPLPEQRAIVSKIEQLFSDLDNGIDNFRKAQAQLKLYRQSVLKAACEGKLVPTEAELARAEGREYEAADVLLARILKERREKWNGRGTYKELLAPDTSGLPALPEGWYWVTMEQISTKVVDGVHRKPNYVSEGIPFITVRNLTAGQGISFEKVRYITEEDHKDFCKRANPEKGDILITKDGTLGIARAIKTENIFSIFVSVAMIKPIKNYLNCDYIETYINSPIGQRQTEKMGEGSGLRHLHLEDLRVMVFPLPPLAEQRRIVAEVERRLSVSDKMEATITESLQKAESLRQSILKKAFDGKLLSEMELEKARNAPDWEPAEKLLERIRQEKQIKEKNNKPAMRS